MEKQLPNDINERICELNSFEAEFYEKARFMDLNDPLAAEMLGEEEGQKNVQIVSFPLEDESEETANSSDGSSSTFNSSGFDSSESHKSARAILATSRTARYLSKNFTPLKNSVVLNQSNALIDKQEVEMEIE